MLKKILLALLSCSFVLFDSFPVPIIEPNEVEASSYNDLGERPFMGWSSWSSIRQKPTEEKIKAAADVLAAKFRRHGYEYVNLDDFYMLDWTNTVDRYGRWVVDPKKFPSGMKAVGDYIHKKGLKFGLYVTLGIPKAAVDQNTPIEGTSYHAKDIVYLSKGQKVNFNFENMYSIDFSKPGAQEFIDSWAKQFASYGVDYLKIDGVRNEDIADVEAWAKALQKTGRPIHVELSNNLDIKHASTWKEFSNGWRTDHDVEAYGKATLVSWKKVSRRFDDVAEWQPHAGPGGWNDLDSLNVANGKKDGLTDEEKRSYVSLWAIGASQFVIGNDLTELDDYGISLLTNDEIIGVNQSGVAGKRLYKTADSQVFYQNLPDGSYNIALFNTGSTKNTMTIKWKDLGIQSAAVVRDLWSHKNLGNMDTGFTATLTSHDSRMIHVIPNSALTVSPKSGATEINPTKVPLKWAPQSGADSYHLQLATDPSFKNIITEQTASLPTITLDNLKTNTRYYWKVSDVTEGTVTQVGIYTFHTKMTTPPATPDWVMANRKNKETVELTWNPTFGATSYMVYRKEVNSFGVSKGYNEIAKNVTDPNYVDKGAERHAGIKYSYFVTATNTIDKSTKSPEAATDGQSPAQVAALIVFISILILTKILSMAKDKYDASKPSMRQRAA